MEWVHELALAGLLHDVGKLGRLGGEPTPPRPYAHAEIGKRFVEKHVPWQWQLKMAPVEWHHGDWEEGRRVENMELPVQIVALADRLASGEREARENEEARIKQLLSIFSRLVGSEGTEFWIRPQALALQEEVIFPGPPLPSDESTAAFRAVWQALNTKAEALRRVYESSTASIESYLESMWFLLRDHTWCVPSAYWEDKPDVSLFSHSHVTSALAACLAHDFWGRPEEVKKLLLAVKEREWPEGPEVALLVEGDIAGIQRFIYSLYDPKGAAAILRARSFFIQLLNEVLARHILKALHMPITCALYIGGGKFTLLLPASVAPQLPPIRRELNRILHADLGLQLVMAWEGLAPRDFQISPEGELPGISRKRQVIGGTLAQQKRQKLSDFDEEELRDFFAPRGYGGSADVAYSATVICEVCGREVPAAAVQTVEETLFCSHCREFQEIGDKLRSARFVRLRRVEGEPPGARGGLAGTLKKLGFSLDLLEALDSPPDEEAVVFALEDVDRSSGSFYGPKQAAGRKFLVNFVPRVQEEEISEIRKLFENDPAEIRDLRGGHVKHFGILARQALGAPYLGVLRMDMDGLGRLFSQGLGHRATISRVATLSFFISLFFEGWTERIAESLSQNGRARLYAVYSGGDDLFFVGSWDAVVDFAYRVRKSFSRFSGRNDLGVSGGIFLCHEKYPLYLGARQAGEAEERAKGFRRENGREKDALSFLGLEIGWEGFAPVQERVKTLTSFVEDGRMPREVMRRILEVFELYLWERERRGSWGPWLWRSEYWLARLMERVKDDQEVKDFLEGVKNELRGEAFAKQIGLWALAARWAELATKRR